MQENCKVTFDDGDTVVQWVKNFLINNKLDRLDIHIGKKQILIPT